MLDPSLTDEEVPDNMINARPILRSANRRVLKQVGMNEAEYDALPQDDVRREIFEEAVIRYGTIELIPIVAQLVSVNANGIMTRFQEINWKDRIKQLAAKNRQELRPYAVNDDFYGAISRNHKRG